MKILFLHPNFPAQFRHLATALGRDSRHQVVFGTLQSQGQIPGVQKVIYQPSRQAHPHTHHYVRSLENAVLQGQAVYRLCQQLRDQGFVPDIVYGHSGWGPTLFIKDIFPKARLLCYFEWYYHAHGSDADFDPADPLDADGETRIRVKNAPILLDLDRSRLHFTGLIPYHQYLQVLQASTVHVYLTRPFVLSWSLLEAMATGCLVLGSDTAPVREVIRDGENGLLVDFFDVGGMCDRIEEALDYPKQMAMLRTQARATMQTHYDLAQLLPQHLAWLSEF